MYKVSIILLSILIYLMAGIWTELKTPAKIVVDKKSAQSIIKKKEVNIPKAGYPAILEIPKLQIRSNIEFIGVDENGKMGVPQDINNVGWYSFGYRPGENGNAVIAGHYDTVTGAPAIFYYLSALEPGDEIRIIDNKKKTYTFFVTLKEVYDYDKAPVKQLFISDTKPKLNLITCAGYFDYISQNYLQRSIIYAEIAEFSPYSILTTR